MYDVNDNFRRSRFPYVKNRIMTSEPLTARASPMRCSGESVISSYVMMKRPRERHGHAEIDGRRHSFPEDDCPGDDAGQRLYRKEQHRAGEIRVAERSDPEREVEREKWRGEEQPASILPGQAPVATDEVPADKGVKKPGAQKSPRGDGKRGHLGQLDEQSGRTGRGDPHPQKHEHAGARRSR